MCYKLMISIQSKLENSLNLILFPISACMVPLLVLKNKVYRMTSNFINGSNGIISCHVGCTGLKCQNVDLYKCSIYTYRFYRAKVHSDYSSTQVILIGFLSH